MGNSPQFGRRGAGSAREAAKEVKIKHRNRITEVSIEGFRSLKRIQGVKLNDLNILIGANGSGKSNFIGFFQMLGYALTESLQRFIQTRGFGDSMLFMGSKNTPILKANLELDSGQGENHYEFTMAYATPDTLIYTQEQISYQPADRDKPYYQNLEVGGKESALIRTARESAENPGTTNAAKYIRGALGGMRVYQFHDTSLSAYIRKTADIGSGHRLYHDGGNLAAVLYNLKTNHGPYYKRVVDTVRRMVPDFKDFVLEPETHDPNRIMLRWQSAASDYELGPHQISDGSLRFMALATLLLQPEDNLPDMVIIDEPELGLHPAAEVLVGALLDSVSKKSQVIVSTQSSTFVDLFAPEDIIVTEMKDGATTLKRPSADHLKIWLQDYSMGEIWRKNLIGGRP